MGLSTSLSPQLKFITETQQDVQAAQQGRRHGEGLEESLCKTLCSLPPVGVGGGGHTGCTLPPVAEMQPHIFDICCNAPSSLFETHNSGCLLGADHIDFSI